MIRRRNIDESHRDTFIVTDLQASSIASKIVGIVPVKCELVSAKEVHGTAAGQTGTLAIERLQGVETSGEGDSIATGIDLEGTADTVQSATVVTTGTEVFEAGNRIGVILAGNSATCATAVVMLEFRPVD